MTDWVKAVQTARVYGQAQEIGHLRGDISGLQRALKIKQQEVADLIDDYNELSNRFNKLLENKKALQQRHNDLQRQIKEKQEVDDRLSLLQDKEYLSRALAGEQHLSQQLQAAQARLIDPQKGLYNWCAAQLELLQKRLVIYLLTRDGGQSKEQLTFGDPALIAQLSLDQRREGNMRLLGVGTVFWEAFVRSPRWLRGVVEHGTQELLQVVAEQGAEAGKAFLAEKMLPTADQALALALDQTRQLGNDLAGEEGLEVRSERCYQAARKDLAQGLLRFKKDSPLIVYTSEDKGVTGITWSAMMESNVGTLTRRYFFAK